MGSELKVGDIMTKKVIVIDRERAMVDAAKMMKRCNLGSIVVVNGGAAVGIITERDIVHKVVAMGKKPDALKVTDVMSKPLRVIKPTATLEEAAKAMKKNKIKRLPVINDKNELIGILSEGDLSRLLPSIIDLIEEKALLR
ncbi:CBS domain-containing protein [Candidatus Micrarchaeota archaeon]|nr:CBS domain-containing protein [Candidatus Micrarchaeota archaeon]